MPEQSARRRPLTILGTPVDFHQDRVRGAHQERGRSLAIHELVLGGEERRIRGTGDQMMPVHQREPADVAPAAGHADPAERADGDRPGPRVEGDPGLP